MKPVLSAIVVTLASLPAPRGMAADGPPADPYAAMARYEFGQSRLPLATIDEQIRKMPPSGYKDIEARLLAVLKSPQTTKDAKRFICRWLGVVGSPECIPAVAELLTDEALSHPARIALEPMRDPAAGAALRNAVPKLKGKLLAGVISSIAARRDGEAVPLLSGLASNSDPLVAGAAISALGAVGTEEAAKALDSVQAPAALSPVLARAKIAAASRLAAAGKSAEAARIYATLLGGQKPQATGMAAVKGLVATLPRPDAAKLVIEMVQGADDAMRSATTAALVASPDKAMKNAVAAQLPHMNAAGQLALLGVLADQPDVALRPAVLEILARTSDVRIRLAALECLELHGEAADVPLVVRLARAEPKVLAELAYKVLERMEKPRIDAALVRLIQSPDAGDRRVVLTVLASRRVQSALPALVRLLEGPDAAMAAEAARALGAMGKTEQLAPLAAVLLAPKSAELRGAAEDAAAAICSAASDKKAAAKPLLAALERAAAPPSRVALLRLLVYTRGEEALTAVRRAIRDENAEVREAAIRTLVAWPEAAAVPHLIDLAKTAEKPSHAVLALRDGCLRLAGLKDLPVAERVAIYHSVLEVAKRPDEKKQAIAGLAQLPSLEALELLEGCTKDTALGSDATLATIRLARQLGTFYQKRAMAALERLKPQAAGEKVKKELEEAIRAVRSAGQSPEGFLVAWLLSGPYVEEGKSGQDLFDVAFAPEKPGGRAQWRPVVLPPDGKPGLVEIDKILSGHDRAAYLRTRIASAKEQDAALEIGSDDGVKVWLNGRVVHANNAVRPCTPGQDKVKVRLQQGPNVLLLKITQGGGEWSACCRVCAPDGKPLQGLTVAPDEP